ncbi:tripartite tricarboxylate transporter substrate-binding protein [Pseudonocardia sp. ICBG1142]|uniref:tripartite tricarboxylate transporter substrate-binding protein n=1 Tax=Pseudonocardia sp. ICBG1142 TaxID=2846760 RepID=UPI002102E3D4|nr:tripartite tricarboxylate transporter substrate-binding protein [Pseudonocardia sp. ICBG1142]
MDIPTTHEFGINIELFNWRGLIAPPGLSLTQRAALEGVIASLVATPQWKQHLAENNWQDAHLSAAQFHAFLNTEAARVRRVLGGLGVA